MPVTTAILPAHGVVIVRYSGHVRVAETEAAIAAYMTHPDRRPGQKQLVDLSGVTGHEPDMVRLMAVQAQKAALFAPPTAAQTLIAYVAPGEAAFAMARMILRSWQGVPGVVASVQRHEEAALDILGLQARRIDELMRAAE